MARTLGHVVKQKYVQNAVTSLTLKHAQDILNQTHVQNVVRNLDIKNLALNIRLLKCALNVVEEEHIDKLVLKLLNMSLVLSVVVEEYIRKCVLCIQRIRRHIVRNAEGCTDSIEKGVLNTLQLNRVLNVEYPRDINLIALVREYWSHVLNVAAP